MSWKAVDISCKKCGKSLRDGTVKLALEGDMLGARIIIECPHCHRFNRFSLRNRSWEREE